MNERRAEKSSRWDCTGATLGVGGSGIGKAEFCLESNDRFRSLLEDLDGGYCGAPFAYWRRRWDMSTFKLLQDQLSGSLYFPSENNIPARATRNATINVQVPYKETVPVEDEQMILNLACEALKVFGYTSSADGDLREAAGSGNQIIGVAFKDSRSVSAGTQRCEWVSQCGKRIYAKSTRWSSVSVSPPESDH